MTRTSIIVLASLLAACSVNGDDNAADSNMAADEPIMGESGQPAAPVAPGNEQAPAPTPPSDGQPAPEPSGDVTLSASPSRTAAGSTMTLRVNQATALR